MKKRKKYGNPAKNRLVTGDLQKLLDPTGIANPRNFGGSIHSFADSHTQAASLLDLTDVVLLEDMEVCTVDTVRSGLLQEQVMFMTLNGRINKTKDHVNVGFIFGPDGAAAIITELLALADRFGTELLVDMTSRLRNLKTENNASLHFLRSAIDLALEED